MRISDWSSDVCSSDLVEDHVGDAGRLRALGDEFADLAGLGGLVTIEGTQVGLEGGCGGHGVTLAVVDHLDEHVACRTGHDQTRTDLAAHDLLAEAPVTTAAGVRL